MKGLPQKDFLALMRTRLALERTFLSYFRTFLVLLSSGLVIIKIEFLNEARKLGVALIVIASLMLVVGLIRFLNVRSRLIKYSKANQERSKATGDLHKEE